MTEPSPATPTKRRSGWRMLGLIVLGMVLLAIGGGVWWYYDDGDLEVVRTQARKQGRPLIWSDLKLVPTIAERLHQWQRVVDLSQKLTNFQSKAGPDGKFYKVWDPVPEAMRTHHAAVDAAMVSELADLLDRLGDHPLVLHDKISHSRLLPEIAVARALIRFMQERLILAEPHEAGQWARRMLGVCRRFAVDSLILHMISNSLFDATLNGIAVRLADLKQNDSAIAEEILATLRPRHGNLLRAFDGEFLMMLDALTHPGNHHNSVGPDGWYMPLLLRAGRHGMLSAQLDHLHDLSNQDAMAVLAWSRAIESKLIAARDGIPTPSVVLQGMYMSVWSVVISQGELIGLRGRVIAAELHGTSWPVDVFDPSGAPVRAILRDGRLIAAYTVHLDGIDQGGDQKRDRVIALYADPSKP